MSIIDVTLSATNLHNNNWRIHMKKNKLILSYITAAISIVSSMSMASAQRLSGDVEVFTPRVQNESFGYSEAGARAPENWGNLTAFEGNECGIGRAQSPVNFLSRDIEDSSSTEAGTIEINYSPDRLAVENLGTTIEFPMSSSSNNNMVINGVTYNLAQFHLHTPSEHTVDGAEYPLELHFVHVRQGAEGIPLSGLQFGDLAVLGVMVTEGDVTTAFPGNNGTQTLSQIVPRNENVEFIFSDNQVNPAALLPELNEEGERPFYRYDGSLTTPPCSELVLWSVFNDPITMSTRQIRVFREALGDMRFAGRDGENDRPTQPLNNREVVRGGVNN